MRRKPKMGNFFSGSGTWELAAKICGIEVVFESEIEPFPVALEAKRFPEAIQLGDVSKVNGADLPYVDILTNSSPCFVGDSLVRTNSGLKEIKDVKVGDMVLTHTGRFRKVTDSGCTGTKKTMTIKGMGFREITATPNHPFYVRHMKRRYPTFIRDGKRMRGNERTFSDPEWVKLEDIKKWDFVGIPIRDGDGPGIQISDEDLWLVGRYIADGYRRKDQKTVAICIGKAKYEEFMSHITRRTGYTDDGRTAYKYCISGSEFYELCGACGDGAINKRFPEWTWDLDDRQLGILLEGYMSGDGWHNKDRDVYKATTISKTLAYDLQYVATRLFKTPCSIWFCERNPTCVIEGRTVNQHDTWTVMFAKHPHKQDKAFYEDGYVWYPVRSVEWAGTEDVYNLTVEGDNSYTVQNIAVHNCQDLSIAGRRDGLGGGRSGLFHEVIRITKEMRDAYSNRLRSSGPDEPVRLPGRFWCWENVPGAFNSNRGEDFRVVLEEVARIIDPEAVIPMPPKGKWSYSGIVDGDGYQIAWRTLDAQFFGVPQRRRRVFLVADFGGHCASEVLFEYEGLSWNFEKIAETWEDTSRSFDDRIDSASRIVLGGVPQTPRGVGEGELNRPE